MRTVARLTVTAAMVGGLPACDSGTSPPLTPPAAIVVSPDSAAIRVGHSLQMIAVVTDSAGDTLSGYVVSWSSSDTSVATVSTSGLAAGVSAGNVAVTAALEDVQGGTLLTVLIPVGRTSVYPDSVYLVPGGAFELTPRVNGDSGEVLSGRPIVWVSSDSEVVTVSPEGMVTAVAPGTATIEAISEGVGGRTARIVVETLRFVELGGSPRAWHSCARTAAARVYCWGYNYHGQLGNGTSPRAQGTNGTLLTPTGVIGNVPNAITVTTGGDISCLVSERSSSLRSWCWGLGADGRLGDGRVNTTPHPVFVKTDAQFVKLAGGFSHTCALTTDSLAYCWGDRGGLGHSAFPISVVPQPVQGGFKYQSLHLGYHYTCGLTADSTAYCWGQDNDGVLGRGGGANREFPQPVVGGFKFVALAGGDTHMCGVAADSLAYCWGKNRYGQLGTGSTTSTDTPVAVSGGLKFSAITAGNDFTCALDLQGRAHCWGLNTYGQLGAQPTGELCDSYNCSTTPVQVVQLRWYSSLVAGAEHVCGIEAAGLTYCWGNNGDGQLGDGTTTSTHQPTRVRGQ